MTPIFVACKGGTGSSLLAQTLIACGMNPGNDRTYYSDRFRNDNAEHSLMTALCHMWMDEEPDKRLNVKRPEQIIDAKVDLVATACPFCLTMFEDGLKTKEAEESIKAMDLSELIAEAL